MDIKKLTQEVLLKNMTPEQQLAILESVTASVKEAKAVQKQKITENVDLVLQALKRIEADMLKRVEGSAKIIEDRVKTIKDGKDGKNGIDGKAGKDGINGKDGKDGRDGKDGLNGVAGERGQDGVGVQDAHIDFDGSLIISLTNGQELNVGEVVPFDVAEKIRVIGNGGGTSQFVIDTLADLQTQIDSIAGGLTYKGTWNASTNSPTLTSSSGTKGWYYVVGTAGSTNLNGVTDWQVGDWAIFNGSTWQKIDQSNLVTSVAGRTGDVTLTSADVGLGNVENKSSATIRGELTAGNVTTALGYTPYNSTNPNGYTTNTGTVTSVAVSGGTTGLTTSGGPVTGSGTITLAGTLAIANGGTGATSASAALTALGAYPASNPNGYTTNTGTVTSVTGTSPVVSSGGTTPAISLAASYGDTQNPYASKTANYILAAPNGSSGVPTFRAIVASDIPTLNQNTTGTASNVTGVVAEANGGTGTSAGNHMFKNRIINGAMMIDQRNAGAAVTGIGSAGTYIIDRWKSYATYTWSGGAVFAAQQNKGAVTPPPGFKNYIGVQTTTADATLSGNCTYDLSQAIEGFNIADLDWGTANAKSITFSFWVYSNLTGTFGGSLSSSASTYSCAFSYSVSVANTWTYCTVTVAGPTSGTWLNTNGAGVFVSFSLGCASSRFGTSGVWGAAVYSGVSGQQQISASTSNYLYITGVQLEKGSTATSFDYRPYGTELALCQRYYQTIANFLGYMTSTTATRNAVPLSSALRATPTVAVTTTSSSISNPSGTNGTPSTISNITYQTNGTTVWFDMASSTTMNSAFAGSGCLTTAVGSLSSEL